MSALAKYALKTFGCGHARSGPICGVRLRGRRSIAAAVGLCLVGTGPAIAKEFQPNASLRAAVETFVNTQSQHYPAEPRVTVSELDSRLRLPACSGPLATFFPPGSQRIGATSVGVRCPGPKTWTIYVPVTIEVSASVLVARRHLPRGTQLDRDDIAVADRALGQLHQGYFSDPAQAIGQILKQPIAMGSAITPGVLGAPILVRRGQSVSIIATVSGLEVRAAGVAMNDGSRGDQIRVRNVLSKRIIPATVTAEGVVNVQM